MSDFDFSFDATTVEPVQNRDFSAIPRGPQVCQIVKSELRKVKPKDGQDPDGDYGTNYCIEVEIVEGQYERRKLWDQMTIESEKEETVRIARARLGSIAMAVGKPKMKAASDLHFIPFIAELSVVPDWRTKDLPHDDPNKRPPVNKIVAYKPLEGGGTVATQQPARASAGGGLSNGAQGGGGFSSASTSGGGASGGGGLPWGKGR